MIKVSKLETDAKMSQKKTPLSDDAAKKVVGGIIGGAQYNPETGQYDGGSYVGNTQVSDHVPGSGG